MTNNQTYKFAELAHWAQENAIVEYLKIHGDEIKARAAASDCPDETLDTEQNAETISRILDRGNYRFSHDGMMQ